MFAERYVKSVNSSDLRDDELHHAAEPLRASAYADLTGNEAMLGSLLCRVKYADGTVHKLFEAGTANLADLLRLWTNIVISKGRARKWVPENTAWDVQAAFKLYDQVAAGSLAHWLDGRCKACEGARVTPDRRTCTCCAGTGREEIAGGRFVTDKTKDMVSELEGIFHAYSGRAKAMLRDEVEISSGNKNDFVLRGTCCVT